MTAFVLQRLAHAQQYVRNLLILLRDLILHTDHNV
jgi:hypothetical protein